MRTWIIALVMVVALGLTGMIAWGFGAFRKPDEPIATNIKKLEPAKATDMEQALLHITTARDKFASAKDYRATFLRDEYIDGALRENYLKLKVRHEPFSVYMEWLAPESKKGRKSIYVEGQNNGKMRVREPIAGFAVTVSLDPEESKKRKESRHTIKEAGYKNLVTKYTASWEKEKDLNVNKVTIQDGKLEITLPDRAAEKLDCTVVTTIHDPKDKDKFQFYRSVLYFNKANGQLVRVEAYDWPTEDDKNGQLVERYTYLNVETNVGLTDADFKL